MFLSTEHFHCFRVQWWRALQYTPHPMLGIVLVDVRLACSMLCQGNPFHDARSLEVFNYVISRALATFMLYTL